jgi:3',5'-cyclic-nucleotide phosphodiesterase
MIAVLLTALLTGAGPAKPQFELRALGVLGGDEDRNLSCFLLGAPGEEPRVMIDAGSIIEGLSKDPSPSARIRAALPILHGLDAVLITHPHLDHVAGLLLVSPVLIGAPPPRSIRLLASTPTLEALRTHLLAPPIWFDPPANVLRLEALDPTRTTTAGPFKVESVELTHPVPSAAFLFERGGEVYAHLGDTGPTDRIWAQLRPLLDAGRLRAIAVEVSFPSDQEKLARATGHLTPQLLVAELAKLSPSLKGVTIIAIHIKAAGYDRVKAELSELRRSGLEIRIPTQGDRIRF